MVVCSICLTRKSTSFNSDCWLVGACIVDTTRVRQSLDFNDFTNSLSPKAHRVHLDHRACSGLPDRPLAGSRPFDGKVLGCQPSLKEGALRKQCCILRLQMSNSDLSNGRLGRPISKNTLTTAHLHLDRSLSWRVIRTLAGVRWRGVCEVGGSGSAGIWEFPKPPLG